MKILYIIMTLLFLSSCSNNKDSLSEDLANDPTISIQEPQISHLGSNDITIVADSGNISETNIKEGIKLVSFSITNTSSLLGKIKVSLVYQNSISFSSNNTSCGIDAFKLIQAGQSCRVAFNIDSNLLKVGVYPFQFNIQETEGNQVSHQFFLSANDPFQLTSGENSFPSGSSNIICKSNYHIEHRTCFLDIKSCSSLPQYALSGTQTWSNGSYGSCQIATCSGNKKIFNNSCIDTSRVCSTQPENSSGGNESLTNSIVGEFIQGSTLSYGSCLAYTCNTGFSNVNGICKQTIQNRQCTVQPDHSENGTEGTIDGGQNWSNCSGYTCLTGYAMNNSQCVPNVKNFGSYRSWSDSTYANTCELYKNPGTTKSYSGDIGNYIYRMLQISSLYDVFCDMSTTPAYMDIMSGLVSSFSFDSASPVTDSISGNTSSTLITDTTLYAGKRSNAIRIRGFSGSVNWTSNMTTCAWMNMNNVFTPSTMAHYYGYGRYSGNVNYNGKAWYRLSPLGYFSGTAQVVGPVNGTSTNSDASVLNDANWHHYCTVLNNTTKTAKTYRDGVWVYTASNIANWGGYGSYINFVTEVYDELPASVVPRVDEWKLYNRELTNNEITILSQNQIYNGYLISNGDFSNGLTGWTGSNGTYEPINNFGRAIVSVSTNGANYFGQNISTTVGSTYKVTYNLVSVSTNAQSYAYAITAGGNRRDGTYLSSGSVAKTFPGSYSYTFIANSTTTQIVFATEVASSGNSVIDNVSVQLQP